MASKLQQGSFTSLQLTRACLFNCLRADRLDRSGAPPLRRVCRPAGADVPTNPAHFPHFFPPNSAPTPHPTPVCEVVPDCFERAKASDRRRASGQPLGMVEGIPFSFKECLRLQGMDSSIGLPSLTFTPSTVTQSAMEVRQSNAFSDSAAHIVALHPSEPLMTPFASIQDNHRRGRHPAGLNHRAADHAELRVQQPPDRCVAGAVLKQPLLLKKPRFLHLRPTADFTTTP